MPRKSKVIWEGPSKLRPFLVPLAKLSENPRNARTHDETNIKAIAASLSRFGQLQLIVSNEETGFIVAGHGRLEGARRLKWTHLAVLKVQQDEWTADAYALADNRTTEMSHWDRETLLTYLPEVADQDQELFDLLLLDRFLPREETEPEPVPVSHKVVVTCKNEKQQKALYRRLKKEKFECHLLIQ